MNRDVEDPTPYKAIAAMCRVFTGDGMKHGARAYVERCATKDGKDHYLSKAATHMTAYLCGVKVDHDSGESPLAHVMARLACVLESELTTKGDHDAKVS